MSNADRCKNPGKQGGNTGPRNPIEAKGRTQTRLSRDSVLRKDTQHVYCYQLHLCVRENLKPEKELQELLTAVQDKWSLHSHQQGPKARNN